jgi:cleavage and polyadenylation specificity factor subunit 1
MEHVRCTLDMSQATFVEPNRLIVSLKGGELYIVTLITDAESLRTVRSIHIEKGPSSVISSCLTKCGEQFLFIGSRLGNSVLLKHTKTTAKSSNAVTAASSITSVSSAVLAPAGNATRSSGGGGEYEELDKLLELNEVKSAKSSIETTVTHLFDVCDILLNIAPCGHAAVGESAGDYSDFGSTVNSCNIDLVTSSGHTKNGAISILQRSLRPECIATFQIPDIVDMWSVGNDEKIE